MRDDYCNNVSKIEIHLKLKIILNVIISVKKCVIEYRHYIMNCDFLKQFRVFVTFTKYYKYEISYNITKFRNVLYNIRNTIFMRSNGSL